MSQLAGEVQPGFLRMPKLPVSGLFVRLLAFVLDIFLIISALHLISRNLEGTLWALGEWSNYLGGILTFAYLVLFNGPFGKGRTIGKMILGIHVTDYDGRPPTYAQAIIRTVVLIPIFVLGPLTEFFFGPASTAMQDYIKTLLTLFPFWAIVLGTVLTLAFNPFKQGLHDYFAQTLVRPMTPKDEPVPTFEDLVAKVGRSSTRFHRQPQYSGGVSVLLFMSLFAFLAHPSMQPPDARAAQDARYRLTLIPGMENALIRLEPIPAEDFYAQERAAEQESTPAPADAQAPLTLEELGLDEEAAREVHEDAPPAVEEPEPDEEQGPVSLVIPVVMHTTWSTEPDNPRFQIMADRLLNEYYETVMPHVLRMYADDPHRRFEARIQDWTARPIELQAVFHTQIDLRPYQIPLRRLWAEYSLIFPPLEAVE